jgi:ATP-binding cassette subfamily B (MDR/TAP) protein 1
VLESANISFQAGKTTFIIGPSGSGKSTLASLLLRFYSPCSGEILIDGNSIQKIDARWIRNNITLVQQQGFLFNETILQNIIFGSKNQSNVTRQQMETCIETARLQDVISHLPEGLETVVGIRGNLLSGGQKQRVAIARARLRDSPILILDECTCAVDYKNRIAVMDAIRTWRKRKTTIIITHDTSQILERDFAYILEQGRVVDSGYRRDLTGRNANLFSGEKESLSNSQSSGSIFPEAPSTDCSPEFSDNSISPLTKQPRWKPEPELQEHPLGSLQRVLLTIPSTLSLKRRRLLVLALVCGIMHASAGPIFSYLLSRLFQAFYAAGNRANLATRWSLALLGLAVGDAIVSFVMQYLLEYCSQVWIDSLRNEAMRRLLDQPCSWFEEEENKPLYLTACLDQNAEEIRNLVGRFAGAVLIAAVTTIMAGVWSFVICWKLTLASLACGPFIYAITKGLDSVNRKWEVWGNDIDGALASIFSETFSDICTVRAFTLESYFSSKHSEISRKAMSLTLKRAGYPGIFFGLGESVIIFASGEKFADWTIKIALL